MPAVDLGLGRDDGPGGGGLGPDGGGGLCIVIFERISIANVAVRVV